MAKNPTTNTTRNEDTQPGNQDDIVEMVVDGFRSSWNYTSSSYHKYWQDMADLYDSKRINVGYNGISDTFVPMSFETIERMVAATTGDKPAVEYIPTNPSQKADTDVLNGMFSFYWDLDFWTLKSIQHSRSLYKLGTAIGHVYWDIDHPVWSCIPLRDFFCDPTATILDYEKARFMGHRFLASKSALKDEMIVDPEQKKLVPKYQNIDKLTPNFKGDATDKQIKDTHMGSTLDGEAVEDQIEVICYETHDDVYYIGNREQVIYHSKNYFKQRQEFLGWDNPTGMFSYFIDANLADDSLLYGRSTLQSISKPQELLNDITNQNVDSVSWSLDPVMELDPQYSSYIEKIKNVTGAVYPFKPGSYSAVNKPPVPTNAFNERSIIKSEIHEATGINELMTGGSRITAAAINYEQALATQRFDLLTTQIENGGFYKLAKMVFALIRLYVTKEVMFRVVGKTGVDWQKFNPKDFEGDYEPRVRLQTYLDKKKQMKMRDLKELYTSFLGNPFVDQQQLTSLIIQKAFDLEPDEAASLITQAPPQASGDGKQQQKPEDIALAGIAKSYGSTAPPDISAQLETIAGLQPSITHGGAMESQASQHIVDQASHGSQLADLFGASPMTPGTPSATPPSTPPRDNTSQNGVTGIPTPTVPLGAGSSYPPTNM